MTSYLPVSSKDLSWLNRACKEIAAKNDTGDYRLAAIAVKGGSILSVGTNKYRNDPMWLPELDRTGWSIHAEQDCLKGIDGNGVTLYIVRLTPGGKTALALPCQECQKMTIERNVSKIVYTTNTGVETLRLRDLPTPVVAQRPRVALERKPRNKYTAYRPSQPQPQ